MKGKIRLSGGRAIVMAIAVCLIVSVIFASIIAALLLSGTIPESGVRFYGYIGLSLGAFCGSLLAARGGDTGIAIRVAILGGLYMLILCVMGILIFDGPVNHLFQNMVSILLGCVAACAICIRKGRAKPRRKKVVR